MLKKKLYCTLLICLAAAGLSSLLAFAAAHTFSDDFESNQYAVGESLAGHRGWGGDLKNTLVPDPSGQSKAALRLINGCTYHSFGAVPESSRAEASFLFIPRSGSDTEIKFTCGSVTAAAIRLDASDGVCRIGSGGHHLADTDAGKNSIYRARITMDFLSQSFHIGIYSCMPSILPGFYETPVLTSGDIPFEAGAELIDGISLEARGNSPLYIDEVCIDVS